MQIPLKAVEHNSAEVGLISKCTYSEVSCCFEGLVAQKAGLKSIYRKHLSSMLGPESKTELLGFKHNEQNVCVFLL